MLGFFVGQSGLAAGAPVDYIITSVDELFFIQLDEYVEHRFREPFIHRKARPLPIARASQFLQLPYYRGAVLLAPLPDLFNELFSPQILALLAVFGKLPLDDVLRRYTCVIRLNT